MIMQCPTCKKARWQWERYPWGDVITCLGCSAWYPVSRIYPRGAPVGQSDRAPVP